MHNPRSANRRQLQPSTPTDLGRGSEGLVLRLREGGIFLSNSKAARRACSRQVV